MGPIITTHYASTLDLRRAVLAQVAARTGVTLTQDETGRWFAASPRIPAARHFVTLVSCTCGAFCGTGACVHHSALLAHLGQLPAAA